MKNTKHPLTLKRFMFGYLKVFAVILLILMIFVYMYLQDYQKNLPSDAGARVIKALQTSDVNTLDDLSSNFPAAMKSAEAFSQYMKTFGDTPDLYFYAGTSKIADQLVFIIANHDKKMATLTLEKTGKKSLFGFQEYKVLDLIFKPVHVYKVIINAPVDVLINGVSIADQAKNLTKTPMPAFTFTKSPLGNLETQTYTFKDFTYIANVSVTDHPEVVVNYDASTYTYSVIARPDQTIQKSITTFGEAFIKAHTRLLSIPYLSSSALIKTYAYPGSPFESTVKSYDLTVRYPFISDSFSDFSITNFIKYGAHAYSADVKITYTFTSTWTGQVKTRTTKPAYKIYVTDINGSWQVTALSLISSN